MRLTLRTLLAYLDDILEPDDREAIAKKIEDSEFAKKLVHRSHDVVSRLRLGAPPVLGGGMTRDPNAVSEYLDNTMAPEQIQDFEKTCLESDAHLAEVAACHHILTMIMGEPVQVDPATRERMYRLSEIAAAQLERTSAAASAATDASAAEPEGPTAAEEREAAHDAIKLMRDAGKQPDEKPTPSEKAPPVEQLPVGARSNFWPVALSAVIGALVCLAVFVAIDPSLRQRLFGGGDDANANKPATVAQGEPGEQPAVSGTAATTSSDGAAPTTAAAAADGSGTTPPKPNTPADNTTTSGTTNGATDGETTPPAPTPPAEDDDGGTDAPPHPAIPTPPPPMPDDNVAPVPTPPMPPTPPASITDPDHASPAEPVKPTTGDSSTGKAPGTKPPSPPQPGDTSTPPGDQVAKADGASPADPNKPKPAPAPPGVEVGGLLSADAVLLSTRGTLDNLGRVAPQGRLSVGDKLVVLPLFRPRVSLAAATVDLEGPAMIEIVELLENEVPHVKVHYGRMITRSLPGGRLRLSLGGLEGFLSFADADSICAIEVRPYRIAGTDPEKVPSNAAVDLYVPSGRATWSNADGDRVIEAPARLVLSPYPDDEAATSLPTWIQSTEPGPLDLRGLAAIDEAVIPDRSVRLSLVELTENRRAEIRWMAVRSCAHIGHFDPLIRSLGDPDDKAYWHRYIPELAAAVARDATTAAKVRKAFEAAQPETGFQLYRMLWGYSTTGLKNNGEAQRLVDYLENDLLEFRVLSFWNLEQITGGGTYGYRPEYANLKNRRAVERWRELLEKGEIVPKRPGAEPPTAP